MLRRPDDHGGLLLMPRRAAFAAYYLSLHPGDVEALKELLGNRNIATTQVYLRKFDKATAMERVRDLSWDDVAVSVNGSEPGSSEIAAKTFESLAGVGAGGFRTSVRART
jgi:hypothetical protein